MGILTPFAFCAFLWFTLHMIGLALVSPDLGVAAMVFLAAGLARRIALPGANWKHSLAFGFVLGAGYYVKMALLPLGLALSVVLFVLHLTGARANRRKQLLSLSFSVLVFLLVAAPLVIALSMRVHQLSFGDVGRLDYAWEVNGLRPAHAGWIGGTPAEYGSPEHPPRQLNVKPLILEFAAPIKGTYPLWYDPSYWYAGAHARFDLRQQAARLKKTLRTLKDTVFDAAPFIAGALVLFAFGLREKPPKAAPEISWWLLAWALAGCCMYALVLVEARFLGGFFLLFCLGVYRPLLFRVSKQTAVTVCATVLLTVMVPSALGVAAQSARILKDLVYPRHPDYQLAALGLREMGLRDGDRLAVVGDAFECFYARYDHLRVVAQIEDEQEFWRMDASQLKSVREHLASIGVKAVVASNRPGEEDATAGWMDVEFPDSTRLSVLLLATGSASSP